MQKHTSACIWPCNELNQLVFPGNDVRAHKTATPPSPRLNVLMWLMTFSTAKRNAQSCSADWLVSWQEQEVWVALDYAAIIQHYWSACLACAAACWAWVQIMSSFSPSLLLSSSPTYSSFGSYVLPLLLFLPVFGLLQVYSPSLAPSLCPWTTNKMYWDGMHNDVSPSIWCSGWRCFSGCPGVAEYQTQPNPKAKSDLHTCSLSQTFMCA